MRLNLKTDYALRIMLYAAKAVPRMITAKEVSEAYNITHSNANQIVNTLKRKGYVSVQRGRYGGGFTIDKSPAQILIGDFIKDIEPDLDLVQCFNIEKNTCPGIGSCKLTGLMYDGLNAFLNKMNEKSLADIL
jgi:Rrf2 family transcriptional regulator, nitric oxide-sensitive transcriptional repressor